MASADDADSDTTMNPTTINDSAVGGGVLDLVFGFVKTKVAYQFSKLCAADILQLTNTNGGSGGGSALAFATTTQLDPDLSLRFLRAAAAIGLVTEDDTTTHAPVFTPTALGRSIGSLHEPGRGIVLLEASPEYQRAWDQFDQVLETGAIGWQLAHGVPRIYDSIGSGGTLPEFRETFYGGLRSWGGMEEDAVLLGTNDGVVRDLLMGLTPGAVVVDVGGGEGSFSGKMLAVRPDISVVLQEQAVTCVAARANPALASYAEDHRLRVVERSFFDGIEETEGCLYVLKYILHNWGDEECGRILCNIRVALEKASSRNNTNAARVLIIEHGPIESSPELRLLDLHMAVLCGKGASERTTEEYAKLVEESGLTMHRVHPSKGGVYVLECGLSV